MDVVHGEEPRAERLAALHEVVEVRPRERRAGRAVAGRVERRVRLAVLAPREPHAPLPGERGALPRHRGRDHAVEQVDAARDPLDDVGRRPDAHEVAGPIPGEQLGGARHDVGALGARVADGEAADREPVERVLGQEAGRLVPPLGHQAALHDREQRLLRSRPGRERSQRPAVGPVHRGADRRRLLGRGEADVERHHHVGPDGGLHLDRPLRGEEVRALVHVAAEAGALLGHGAVAREREDLEPTGVREHRAVPPHEAVDPAGAAEQGGAGAEQQVVGVREDHLRAGRPEVVRGEARDGRARADRHERGSLDRAARGRDRAAARGGLGISAPALEGERHRVGPGGAWAHAPGGAPGSSTRRPRTPWDWIAGVAAVKGPACRS